MCVCVCVCVCVCARVCVRVWCACVVVGEVYRHVAWIWVLHGARDVGTPSTMEVRGRRGQTGWTPCGVMRMPDAWHDTTSRRRECRRSCEFTVGTASIPQVLSTARVALLTGSALRYGPFDGHRQAAGWHTEDAKGRNDLQE